MSVPRFSSRPTPSVDVNTVPGPAGWRDRSPFWRRVCQPALAPAAILLCSALPAHAQSTALRFDMGTNGSPVAVAPDQTAYTKVTRNMLFPTGPAGSAYGWASGAQPSRGFDREAPHEYVVHRDGLGPLIEDCVGNGGSTGLDLHDFTFEVEVPSGEYVCVVYLGDLGNPLSTPSPETPLEGMTVRAEGEPVVTDAFARTVTMKASFDKNWGGYKRRTFRASVTDGLLELDFQSTGSTRCALMGVEVYSYTEPPIRFNHGTRKLIASGAASASLEVRLAVVDFNAGRYDEALEHLDGLDSSPESVIYRAWGYAWLLGWLTGEQEPLDNDPATSVVTVDLLDDAIGLLAAADQGDSRVATLLADLEDYRLGELFSRSRGYLEYPDNPDTISYPYRILHNLSAAAQLFEQIDDDTFDPQSSPSASESPVHPQSVYLLARTMYSRNTGLSKMQGQHSNREFNDYLVSIVKNQLEPVLWPATTSLFPDATEAMVFVFRIVEYVDLGCDYTTGGGCLGAWDGTVPPGIDPASSWWSDLVLFGWNDDAPDWANWQRAYKRRFRNLGSWWIENRSLDGDLGGGTGDDPEALKGLASATITHTEYPSHPLESGLRVGLDRVLSSTTVDQDQGYSAEISDSPHAGEITSFPLSILLPTRYGDPYYLEYAMRTIRNMDQHDPDDPEDTDWTDVPAPPFSPLPPAFPVRRHFKAWHFSGTAIPSSTEQNQVRLVDMNSNIRALIPGFHLMDYNEADKAVALFDAYAWAWSDAAMRTDVVSGDDPKPMGLFPKSVRLESVGSHPAGQMGVLNWWRLGAPGEVLFEGGYGAHHSQLYSLLHSAYLRSAEPMSVRSQLLQPIRSALLWLDAGPTGSAGVPGSGLWLAERVSSALGMNAWLAREALLDAFPGEPDLVDAIDHAITNHAPAYIQYLNQPNGTFKDKASIEDMFEDGANFFEYLWPLSTTAVTYTDRIKIGTVQAFNGIYSTAGGAQKSQIPTYPISWRNPVESSPPDDLDFAILVNHYTPSTPGSGPSPTGYLKVLVFNFGPTARDLEMRVWRGLAPADYELRVGDDELPQDDQFDAVPMSGTVTVEAKGDSIRIDGIEPGKLKVIELTEVPDSQIGLPPDLIDLALAENRFVINGNGRVVARVSNVGNADFTQASGTLRLYENGQSIEAKTFGSLPAPDDLRPSFEDVVFDYAPTTTTTLEARFTVSGWEEITKENNSVTKTFVLP